MEQLFTQTLSQSNYKRHQTIINDKSAVRLILEKFGGQQGAFEKQYAAGRCESFRREGN